MKIEEGMRVRTKDDGIQKITKVTINGCFYRTCRAGFDYKTSLNEEDIIGEPSFNIMDLIREGDLVTLKGEICKDEVYRVIGVGEDTIQLDCFQDGYMCVTADDIKQVLTKEQFMRECYEIGE